MDASIRTDVSTIANQLEARHLKWRGYMEDMQRACQHPPLNEADTHERAGQRQSIRNQAQSLCILSFDQR